MANITQPAPPLSTNLHDVAFVQDQNTLNIPAEPSLTTLLVRHLPEAVPPDSLSNLFSYYGAIAVRPYSSGRLRDCAFVDFKSQSLAYQAQRHLNGVRFLGKVLSVERANKSFEDSKCKQLNNRKTASATVPGTLSNDLSRAETQFSAAPIAPRLGIDYPFPPHLEYSYPPPDNNILKNIVSALIAVPRFYTQVLHLMNKMNIPAPFRPALPTPPLPSQTVSLSKELKLTNKSTNESESESESESSDEEDESRRRRKRAKIEKPRRAPLVPKEIPLIKKKNQVLQIKIAPKVVQTGEKPKVEKEKSVEEISVKSKSSPDSLQTEGKPRLELEKPIEGKPDESVALIASAEDIHSKRLGPEEILSLPKFKNYTVGDPSSVLYIKNLDKSVAQDDFFYIFGSLFGSLAAAKASLVVKLMQEGRMRGQAFVTFPSVDYAYRALNLVNGFVFKGKPIIIQFGRNSAVSNERE